MKKFYIAAGIICLLTAAALLIATAALLWPKTAAQTVPTAEAIEIKEPYDPRPDKIDYYFVHSHIPIDITTRFPS